jgi:hypothetical protein
MFHRLILCGKDKEEKEMGDVELFYNVTNSKKISCLLFKQILLIIIFAIE